MFYVQYMLSELRRRRGRTFLTALGLGIGVALVVTVNALSSGLDRAQAEVLRPLTGVGTDISVTRPVSFPFGTSRAGGVPGLFPSLSAKERARLRKENESSRFGLRSPGKPGTKFSRDSFVVTGQLSLPGSAVSKISKLGSVQSSAGGLTLSAIHFEGTVPRQRRGGVLGAPQGGASAPSAISFNSLTVTGVDQRHPELGAITSGQLLHGSYFSRGAKREAILDLGYAERRGLEIGDTITLASKPFTVIGLATTALGGQSSDLYVKLSQLQELSGRSGRVNIVYVRATSADKVAAVAKEIRSTVPGSSTTTAQDLADSVSGSLVSAKNLTSKLGTALEIVGLLAAVLIASLLTLSSVAKRIRELGTLKAIGWSQRLVVRQVTGEALVQGLLGGALGVALGVLSALAIDAAGVTLKASVSSGQSVGFGPFGQGAVATGSALVHLTAPISIELIVLAVLLAAGGGLVAGAAGGLRAARLRPAEALRNIE